MIGWLLELSAIQHAPDGVKSSDFLPTAPLGYRWGQVHELSDEFEGSSLDSSKWLPFHPYWRGRSPSYFDPLNVMVAGGELGLRSTSMVSTLDVVETPEKDIWIKAACVSSKSPIATYGYYEAKVKASRLSMTSSFWLQGKYSEIDVIEQRGAPERRPSDARLMHSNTHYFARGWNNDRSTRVRWPMPVGASERYAVYGWW